MGGAYFWPRGLNDKLRSLSFIPSRSRSAAAVAPADELVEWMPDALGLCLTVRIQFWDDLGLKTGEKPEITEAGYALFWTVYGGIGTRTVVPLRFPTCRLVWARMDGNKEEGSSSQDRPPIPTVHEIGESSGEAEKALQIVTAVTMFKQLMENPRFMEFIQSSSMAHQVQGSFGMPRTVFRGAKKLWDILGKYEATGAGFNRCITDVSVYTRHGQDGLLILALYVDDNVLMAPSLHIINHIKQELSAEFSMTDGVEISYILGIRIQWDRPHSLTLEQSRFADTVLAKFDVPDSSSIQTPLPIRIKELYTHSKPGLARWIHTKESRQNRSILGSIRYYVSCTRSDLSFAAGLLSRFMHDPKPVHHQYAKRLLHYIARTKMMRIVYHTGGDRTLSIRGYTDADWASDLLTRFSTGGYVFTLAGGPISWRSKRQSTVASSSCEAEYRAATDASKEAIWIGSLPEAHIFSLIPNFEANSGEIKLALARGLKKISTV
ncbi:hypothetical protein L7F22_010349 [Adiantum nelumboides]|nr:hypothetical protein [Adiantum nelumboides]